MRIETPCVITAKYDDVALKGIYSFNDGYKLYWGADEDGIVRRLRLRSPDGGCNRVGPNDPYAEIAERYAGGADEHTMSGPDHAEWRRAFRRMNGPACSPK